MQPDSTDSAASTVQHDDPEHEPGDVNGNIDPAYARRAKGATRSQKRRSAAPGTGADVSVPIEPAHDRSAGDADPAEPGQPQVAEGGERRPRRHRRGGHQRGHDRNSNGNRNRETRPGIPDTAGADGALVLPQDATADGASSAAIAGADAPEGMGTASAASATPGAFGDPSRPTDATGRRGRRRQRQRARADNGRSPRDLAEGVDGAEARPIAGDGANGERLHKVLAQQGLGSRRKMEAMIAAGQVEVNGQRAHVGQVVTERDRVHVKRRKVKVSLGDDNPRVLIYHKPAGEIVSRDDPEGRPSVFDRLPRPDHGKWVAVGRLDYNSEGLLLFTTYGELANRLMHPRYEVSREYSVRVLGELTPEQEDQLIDGIELEDGPARVTSLERIDGDSDSANHWYKLTLQEGRNREVRRMFEHLGLTVSRLIRTRYGSVQMPSWLKRGQSKLLDEHETFALLESVGLRSRKKLEKAARFGGARGKLPVGPIGPMRSATEHADAWLAQGGAMVTTRRGRGALRRGAIGPMGADRAPAALQQQQFPGFGGFEEATPVGRRRRGSRSGIGPAMGPGGEVDGNRLPTAPSRSRRKGKAKSGGHGAPAAKSGPPRERGGEGAGGNKRRSRRNRRAGDHRGGDRGSSAVASSAPAMSAAPVPTED
jgi:23S rRNA pseudouridine2605 synthase